MTPGEEELHRIPPSASPQKGCQKSPQIFLVSQPWQQPAQSVSSSRQQQVEDTFLVNFTSLLHGGDLRGREDTGSLTLVCLAVGEGTS